MFWLCIIRVAFKYVFEFRPNACAFIFPIVSLTILNLPVTVVIALVWQSAMNLFIFETTDDKLFNLDDLAFNAVFVVVIAICVKLMDGSDKVIQQMAAAVACYVVLLNVWPLAKYTPITYPDTSYSNGGCFVIEFIATIIIIFTTGPIKVFFDIKRG